MSKIYKRVAWHPESKWETGPYQKEKRGGGIKGPMRWGTNESRVGNVTLGGQWDGGPMRWGTNEMGDQWELCNQGYIGGPMNQWEQGRKCYIGGGGGNEMGDQSHWGTNEMGDQWEQGRKCYIGGDQWHWGTDDGGGGGNEMGDQWDGGLCNQGHIGGGPMRWGNEMGDQWDQCRGRKWGTDEMGDMRAGSGGGGGNEMGDQWDGGPLGLAENGWTNERGTNEKGDQWVQTM